MGDDSAEMLSMAFSSRTSRITNCDLELLLHWEQCISRLAKVSPTTDKLGDFRPLALHCRVKALGLPRHRLARPALAGYIVHYGCD